MKMGGPTTTLRNRPSPSKASRRLDPVKMVAEVCRLTGNLNYLDDLHTGLAAGGLVAAVRDQNSAVLFDWLCQQFAFQGIADGVAVGYMETHGSASFAILESWLGDRRRRACPKLRSFARFSGCGFKKWAWTCGEPDRLATCLVPIIPARKGILGEAAASLYLFIRDVADGDLVGFIDRTIASVDCRGHPDLIARQRQALLDAIRAVRGVANKLLAMSLSTILLGADPARSDWIAVGGSMVAVDTLVHNFLHRTGILDRCGVAHGFGERCYRPGGCADVVDRIARDLDARTFNPPYPAYFPRFVQHAIWAFCAEGGLAICNGRNIDDHARCDYRACPLFDHCPRIALRPAASLPVPI